MSALNFGWVNGVCEVHKYALKDTSPRPVFYCDLCKAYICESCNNNYPLRLYAMGLRAAEKLKGRR